MALSMAKQKYLFEGIRSSTKLISKSTIALFAHSGLILFISGVLWARASLFGEFHPFALAALTATIIVYPRGVFNVLVGIGVGLAFCLQGPDLWKYALLLIMVMVGAYWARRQGNTVTYQLIFGSFYTAAAVLIGRIILATAGGEEPVFLYFAILEAILAGMLVGILSYFGARVKSLDGLHKGLGYEEVALGFLITGISIAGLEGIDLAMLSIQDLVMRIAVLIAAWAGGPGAGAVAGIGMGVVVSLLSNYSPYHLAALAMAGISAGLFREMGKGGLILGFLAGSGLLSYQMLTPAELSAMLASSAVASVIVLILPSEAICGLQGWLPAEKVQKAKASGEEERLRNWVSSRLATFSEVLDELAKSFAQLPQEKVVSDNPDISKMINAVSDRVCSGCDRYQACWVEQFYVTFKNFETALVEAENSGSLQMGQLPPGIKAHCTQVHKLMQAVNYLLELHRVESTWEQKLISSREIVSTQLQGVSEVMASLAEEMQERRNNKADPSKELFAAFLRKRCAVQKVRTATHRDGQCEIMVSCVNCGGKEACRELSSIASLVLGAPLSVSRLVCGYHCGEPICEVSLVPEKAYHLEYKVVKASKKGARVNGDNHLLLALPTGKIGVAISDGMGSGNRAALESSTTLSLLDQLLRAGMDKRFAVRALNSLLLFRSPEESFATLDLLLFDEYTGEAEFVKIGCQPTYIIRGSDIHRIEGQSLPIGIMSQIDASIISEELYPNDYIVMITDGVKDCTPDLPGDWFEKTLTRAPQQGAAELADHLLEQVLAVCNETPQDDLTIAVARVRNKGVPDAIPVYTRRKLAEA